MCKLKNIILYLSCCMVFLLLGYDIYLLSIYATDVPFWDIWDLLPKGNYRHLFSFYNENMQVFYFIISEIMYHFTNWNLRYFVFVNFAVYSILIAIYWKILASTENIKKIPCYPMFLIILLTPMLGYNWLWVFLVQTHTYILFFLLAIYFGFSKNDGKYSAYLCAIFLFLSMISMNIPLAVGGATAYIIKEIINARSKNTNKSLKKCAIFITTLGILIFALSCITNIGKFVDFRPHENVITMRFIKNVSFYLINSLNVFAFADRLTWKICLPLLVIHITILSIVFFEQYKMKEKQALWGIIFGFLVMICGVVSYRQEEVYNYNFGFIRHNETAFMVVPAYLSVLLLSKYRIAKIYGIVIMCSMIFGVGQDIYAKRFQFFGELYYKNGCLCLNHYYNLKTISDWQCTMNFPVARPDVMEKAKEMNLSFIKTIQSCSKQSYSGRTHKILEK